MLAKHYEVQREDLEKDEWLEWLRWIPEGLCDECSMCRASDSAKDILRDQLAVFRSSL